MKYKADKWIATSATELYYEGVVALYNSIKKNAPECKLAVMAFGSPEFIKTLSLLPDVVVIDNPPMPGPILDEGHYRNLRPIGPDMFARLIIPYYFEGRVFYVDADCLILNNIDELWEINLGENYSACVFRPDIGWVGGSVEDEMASGTVLLDCDKWNEYGIVEECFDITRRRVNGSLKRAFPTNVESVLSYVHQGKFLHLSRVYQNLTYYGVLSQEDKVAHFAGPKPWFNAGNPNPGNYFNLWKAYFENRVEEIDRLTSKLPIESKTPTNIGAQNKCFWERKRVVLN